MNRQKDEAWRFRGSTMERKPRWILCDLPALRLASPAAEVVSDRTASRRTGLQLFDFVTRLDLDPLIPRNRRDRWREPHPGAAGRRRVAVAEPRPIRSQQQRSPGDRQKDGDSSARMSTEVRFAATHCPALLRCGSLVPVAVDLGDQWSPLRSELERLRCFP